MKITAEDLERKNLTVEKADAIFSGQASKWIAGEPVPKKFHARVGQFFGLPLEEEPEPSAVLMDDPTKVEDDEAPKTKTKPKSRNRRKS